MSAAPAAAASAAAGAPAAAPEDGGEPALDSAALRRFLRLHSALYRGNALATRLFNAAAVAATAAVLARGPWRSACGARLKAWLLLNAAATVAHAALHLAARANARRARAHDAASRARRAIGAASLALQVLWSTWVVVGVALAVAYRGCAAADPAPYALTAALAVCTLLFSQAYTVAMVLLMFSPGARLFRALSQDALSSPRRPASSAEILSLGALPFRRELFEDDADCVCAICLCAYEDGEELRFLPCRVKAPPPPSPPPPPADDHVEPGAAQAEPAPDGDDDKDSAPVAASAKRPPAQRRPGGRDGGATGKPPGAPAASTLPSRQASRPARRGHGFHVECIDAWLARQRQCPTCRQDIVPAMRPPPESPSPLTNAIRRAVLTGSAAGSAADISSSDVLSTGAATVGTEPPAARSLASSSEPGPVPPSPTDGADACAASQSDVGSSPGAAPPPPRPPEGRGQRPPSPGRPPPPSPPSSPAPLTLSSNPPPAA